MPAINHPHNIRPALAKQRGVAAVEFAVVSIIFFFLFFGIVEMARAMYICNTLQEVTRRAAALAVKADFSNATAMQDVREQAIFRTTPGILIFADPVSDEHVHIDYLRIPSTSTVPVSIGGTPASPAENRINCLRNPNGVDCIRLVRVRICQKDSVGDACAPVPYKTLLSLIPISFPLPVSTTIAKVETLGMPPGVPPPCGC